MKHGPFPLNYTYYEPPSLNALPQGTPTGGWGVHLQPTPLNTTSCRQHKKDYHYGVHLRTAISYIHQHNGRQQARYNKKQH